MRIPAILALSSAKGFKLEVLSTLLKLLKRNKTESDLSRRHATIDAVGFALARLAPSSKEGEPFLPYLVETFIATGGKGRACW